MKHNFPDRHILTSAMINILILTVILFLPTATVFPAVPITIDGLFEDWDDVPVAYTDATGDGNQADFGMLKITNDETNLLLYITFVDGEHLLQNTNDIRLYIDVDNDTTTGLAIRGIGGDLAWCFGCRSGTWYTTTGSQNIWQSDLTLRMAPTITSTAFEISLDLAYSGSVADTILLYWQESATGGDGLPNWGEVLSYVRDQTPVPLPDPIPITRFEAEDLRLITYNTLDGGLLDSSRQERFHRILTALDPDVVAVQEHYTETAPVMNLFQNWFPGTTWYLSSLFHGNFVISRYPILQDAVLTTSERTMAVLLDTEDSLGSPLLVLNSHLACCQNDASRQEDADELTAVMREWRNNGTGPFPLAAETPIVHVGDFNLVGERQQLITLTAGDIVDESQYGADFPWDWDGTPLTDLFSRHTHLRMGYTWRNDGSSFSPGKLDYVLYSNSVLELGNHFVFNTLALPVTVLQNLNLEAEDTNLASDHLPRVVDLAAVNSVSVDREKTDLPRRIQLENVYPNPFNSRTTIRVSVSLPTHVSLVVYDLTGTVVKTLRKNNFLQGQETIQWEGRNDEEREVATGVYLIKLATTTQWQVRKVVLIK